MLVIYLGALFVFGGVVFMVAQPLWQGGLSAARRNRRIGTPPSEISGATLEPRRPGAGFGLKANWPGLLLVVLGGVLLLLGSHFLQGNL
jgi:drug/metabolite transporter (DMT)-like permease